MKLSMWNKEGRNFYPWIPCATWDATGYPRYLHKAVRYKTGLPPSGEAAGDQAQKNELSGTLGYPKRLVTNAESFPKKVDQYLAILKVTTKMLEGLVLAAVFGGCWKIVS